MLVSGTDWDVHTMAEVRIEQHQHHAHTPLLIFFRNSIEIEVVSRKQG